MKDIMGLMKQAQAMQSRMQELQAELELVEVEGQSGSGAVRIVMTAKGVMRSVALDPSLLVPSEKDMLEDLIVTAHEDARKKGEAVVQERMQAVTAGIPLPPGMKLPCLDIFHRSWRAARCAFPHDEPWLNASPDLKSNA